MHWVKGKKENKGQSSLLFDWSQERERVDKDSRSPYVPVFPQIIIIFDSL